MYRDLFSHDKIDFEVLRQRASGMRWGALPEDVIPLTSADPDFKPAKEIREEMIRYIQGGYFPYASFEGIPGLRETLANAELVRNGVPVRPEYIIAVDSAPTGPEQNSDEHKVSIFAKDSRFPYHYGLTNELRKAAVDAGVDYVMDIFTPHYGTDADGSILAGYDIRHGAVGPGTANSHGYERTHMDGVKNTYALLMAFIGIS